MMSDIKYYEDNDLCFKCGGECCKECAGSFSPEDLLITESNYESALRLIFTRVNMMAISCLGYTDENNDERIILFVRPKHKGNDNVVDFSSSGECIYLNKDGCSLPILDRPYHCRMLEPREDGNCKLHCEDIQGELSWEPYQEELEKIVSSFFIDQMENKLIRDF